MPNWCHNTLTVTGEPALLQEFVRRVKVDGEQATPLSFANIKPEPTEAEYDGGGWYGWRVKNWGTKWDASFHDVGGFVALSSDDADVDLSVDAMGAQVTPEAVVYKFDTAWSPPLAVIEAAAELFPALRFELRYGEPGNDFAGRFTAHGDEREDEELKVSDVLALEEMWF
jgi:hypothetical protein